MTQAELYNLISNLPDELKREVADFVTYIKMHTGCAEKEISYSKKITRKGKGLNIPPEDFKEYL